MKFNVFVAIAALATVVSVSGVPTGPNAAEVQQLTERAGGTCCKWSTGQWCGATGCCEWRQCIKYGPACGGCCMQYNC
ncbi:hypothetical protein BG000_004649 [Podila horticola]|nr:hypothetical protein BG000_004649 [Podila horticola]